MQLVINDIKGLQSLIDAETPESSSLEYKAAAAIADSKEIAKDVSSLANGAGGIIIYGMTEKDNKPEQLDSIKGKKYTREYLDQVIALGIQPPIKFKTEAIPHDGGFIYAVHVEQAETAHMSLEQKRYYRRHNFISVAMEDYQVRDVMNRLKHPKVSFELTIKGGTIIPYFVNNGNVLAKHVRCAIQMPKHFIENSEGIEYTDDSGVIYLEIERTNQGLGVIHPKAGINTLKPFILKRDISQVLYRQLDKTITAPLISWMVWADNAEMIRRSIDIKKIEIEDLGAYYP